MPSKAPQSLFKKIKVTKIEKKKYVFNEIRDFQILTIIKELEKQNITTSEREIIKLVKTQLYEDWRKPLLVELRKLQRKYIV